MQNVRARHGPRYSKIKKFLAMRETADVDQSAIKLVAGTRNPGDHSLGWIQVIRFGRFDEARLGHETDFPSRFPAADNVEAVRFVFGLGDKLVC